MIFAATVMLVIGVYQIFVGIAAIAQDGFFVIAPGYAYNIDTTAWGWIHLGIGVIVLAAGAFLYTGATIAKIIAIALAIVSAMANFFFLPYYPVWSLLIIALDVFVIWAIATARGNREIWESEERMATAGYASDADQSGGRWPAENAAGGRHWAPDNVKEGAPQGQQGMSDPAAAERAAAARGAGGRTPPPPSAS